MFLLQGETILEAFGSPEHGVSIIRGKIIYFGKNLSSQNLMQQYHVTRLFTFLTEHIGTASNSAKIRCRNASDWRGKKNGAIKHDFRAKADTNQCHPTSKRSKSNSQVTKDVTSVRQSGTIHTNNM